MDCKHGKSIDRIFRGVTPLVFVLMCIIACSSELQENAYLIRVGSSTITVAEFKQAVEASGEEAFAGDEAISSKAMDDLRLRVLNQLSEELIISERAKQLNISLSDQELDAAIAGVKADYPDDTFEKTLLENAVSFQAWKKKMAMRLLVDKVITHELVDNVQITTEDVSAYFQAHFPDGVPKGEDADVLNKRIVQHLRHQKAEELYKKWIESMRKQFPVDVHQERWNQLVEENV